MIDVKMAAVAVLLGVAALPLAARAGSEDRSIFDDVSMDRSMRQYRWHLVAAGARHSPYAPLPPSADELLERIGAEYGRANLGRRGWANLHLDAVAARDAVALAPPGSDLALVAGASGVASATAPQLGPMASTSVGVQGEDGGGSGEPHRASSAVQRDDAPIRRDFLPRGSGTPATFWSGAPDVGSSAADDTFGGGAGEPPRAPAADERGDARDGRDFLPTRAGTPAMFWSGAGPVGGSAAGMSGTTTSAGPDELGAAGGEPNGASPDRADARSGQDFLPRRSGTRATFWIGSP